MAKSNLEQQWKEYGNLMFYNGFKPTYFYYNWLLSDYIGGRGPSFAQKAHEIGDAAKESLNKGNFLSTDFNSFEEISMRFKPLLDVLSKAITYNRQNEITYFKNKYNEIMKAFTKEEIESNKELNELKTIFETAISTGEFDYDHFTLLINALLQGITNAKAAIAYETQHLKEIEKSMQSLRDARTSQLEGYGYKRNLSKTEIQDMIKKSQDKISEQVKVSYLKQGNLSDVRGVKTHFKNVLSSDVKLAHWITKRIEILWEDKEFREMLREYVHEHPELLKNDDYASIERFVTSTIIARVQDAAIEHMPEILNDSYKRYKTADLIKQFDLESMFNIRAEYNITGWYENYGQYGNRLKLLDELMDLQDEEDTHARDLYNAFDKMISTVNNTKKKSKLNHNILTTVDQLKQTGVYKEDLAIRELIRKCENIMNKYNTARKNKQAFLKKYPDGWSIDINDADKEQVTVTVAVDADSGKVYIKNEDSIKNLESYKQLMGEKDINSESLKKKIAVLKTKANEKLRADIFSILENAPASLREDLIEQIHRGLAGLRVSVGGPKFSELLAGIQFRKSGNDIHVEWTGPKNAKNDVVVLNIITPDGTELSRAEHIITDIINGKINSDMKDALVKIQQATMEDLSSSLTDLSSALNSSLTSTKKERLHKYRTVSDLLLNKTRQSSTGESFIPTVDKIKEKHTKAEEAIQEFLDREGDKNQLEKFGKKASAIALKNSFYVSTTVKTYNEYQNNIGFLGGSLGGNVFEQLTRLQDLFTSAGVPLTGSDFKWLWGAIINCSPISVIGEKDKNSIEHYLGSMAAFALFDEGGAEIILSQMEEDAKPKTAPSILHLYKVNGIYVPGSFVLQQTYNELSECLNQMNIAIESVNRGAGVTIVNTMGYHDIPNQGISSYKDIEKKDPWGYVASQASDKVKIQILFLAKLMDVMNGINTAMGNMEMPT